MRGKIFVGAAATFVALFLGAGPAAADDSPPSFQCNTTVNGGTLNSNVRVPANGVCVLNGVTVNGSVKAGANAYFESNGSKISGNVSGNQSLTLYVWNHSVVGGKVAGFKTPQLFVYDSTIGQSVRAANSVAPGFGHFQVCGSTIGENVSAYRLGPDVLIGDPAAGCGANTIKGDLVAASNRTDSELLVIGNNVPNGDIRVTNNEGGGDKRVNANGAPSGDLVCSGNSAPFDGSKNAIAGKVGGGQCAAATVTGNDNDDDNSDL